MLKTFVDLSILLNYVHVMKYQKILLTLQLHSLRY